VASTSEAEHRLFDHLFEDYNEIIRPVANVSDPVIIQFEVSMSQLVKVVSAGATGAMTWGYRAAGGEG
jgi:nicotinic acetylcholine receptor alpha-3